MSAEGQERSAGRKAWRLPGLSTVTIQLTYAAITGRRRARIDYHGHNVQSRVVMKINLTSIPVQDQDRALSFYTEKVGFVKREDVPMGEHRWLTVVSPEGAEGVELLLEPLGFEPAREFYRALYEAGIPVTSFESADLESEVQRLKACGVAFRGEVQDMGGVKVAIFDDTCGNLVCLTQPIA